MRKHKQLGRYTSPWTVSAHLGRLAFRVVWTLTCRYSPKKLHRWRNVVLRMFGAKISGVPFVDASARIHFPWKLALDHKSCIAARVDVYNLAEVAVGPRSVVSQEVMLCCGTHDFDSPAMELITAPITIGTDAFVGARALILPGVAIGDRAIVGAGCVLSRSAESGGIYAGNPGRLVKRRHSALQEAAAMGIAARDSNGANS